MKFRYRTSRKRGPDEYALVVHEAAGLYSIASRIFDLGHRIVAAFVPGMTAQQAAHREISSANRAVRSQRFFGVAGTARIEAAGRPEHRADQHTDKRGSAAVSH